LALRGEPEDRPRGADAVGAEEGFNLDPENPDNDDLGEKAYWKLEDTARPVLDKLRAGDPRLADEEKGVFSYFMAFQKFRTTLYRETVNAAAVDEFRHTCRRLLDEKRVHEIVGTTLNIGMVEADGEHKTYPSSRDSRTIGRRSRRTGAG
jgi:hypothetical protein